MIRVPHLLAEDSFFSSNAAVVVSSLCKAPEFARALFFSAPFPRHIALFSTIDQPNLPHSPSSRFQKFFEPHLVICFFSSPHHWFSPLPHQPFFFFLAGI